MKVILYSTDYSVQLNAHAVKDHIQPKTRAQCNDLKYIQYKMFFYVLPGSISTCQMKCTSNVCIIDYTRAFLVSLSRTF